MIDQAICPNNVLCDFVVTGDYPEVQKEVCTKCGKRIRYNKVKGKVDNKQYLLDHRRDFVQPHGPTQKTFYEIYGEKVVADFAKSTKDIKTKEQHAREMDDLRHEAKRDVQRLTLSNFD